MHIDTHRFWLLILTSLALASPAMGIGRDEPQEGGVRADAVPAEYKDVGVDEKLGQRIPLDLVFENDRGEKVKLGDYFQKDRPVILQLGYFECPMLCGLISQGMVESLNKLSLEPGKDFQVLNVSFDASETSKLAGLKKRSYLMEYNRPGAAEGLRLFVGDHQNIKQLTDSVGFKYKWVESAKQFSHPAVLVILTPDGQISRYLYGVKFDPTALRLSLVEASAGKIGSTADRVMLICLDYNSATGTYSVAALFLMRLAAIVMVLVLGTVLLRFYMRERKRRAAAGPA